MTTAADDQLAAVLREIAEIEGWDGFEGPKIGGAISSIKLPTKWIEAIIVGEIMLVVKAHWNPKNHLEDWMIDIEDGGDGDFIVVIKDRLGHEMAAGQGPLALAAARAYREAIKETMK
jgi:hypothetical protein